MGVTKTGKTWRARYTVNDVRFNVGTFKTRRLAEEALAMHQWDNDLYPGFIETGELQPKNNPLPIPILARVKNAFNRIRSSAGSKK